MEEHVVSQINPKFLTLPAWNQHAITSATRGPDVCDEAAKAKFTAPIRLWLHGAEGYNLLGVMPDTHEQVTPLSEENIFTLMDEVEAKMEKPNLPLSKYHYFEHIMCALETIRNAESWVDKRDS
jgi:hypothetical protein